MLELLFSICPLVHTGPEQYTCYEDILCGGEIATTDTIPECCQGGIGGVSYLGHTGADQFCTLCPAVRKLMVNEFCPLIMIMFLSTACPQEYNSGILWRATDADSYARVSCREAGSQFSPFDYITRHCSSGGNWYPVDFINCTLMSNVSSFASVSIVLSGNEIDDAMNSEDELEDYVGDKTLWIVLL